MFLVGLVKCAWHKTSGIWNEKGGKLFSIRTELTSSMDASSGPREDAECFASYKNTLHTAGDLGDPGIMSFRADKEHVARELCQPASLGYRVGHGGCLARVGVRGGIIQQTRLIEDLTLSLIGVWMKLGPAGFPILFVTALGFSPQFTRRSATQGFNGPS